ncbi:MAG: tRNA (adenosine(37)-N6)-dimethylallyltransferase MiaA, partial [Bacteroidetes bacterium]|nr:tRNA (adenosine(37)-N6)-dimethylallyltransferase MiaA [Bacteroidota bacterium]
DIGTGKDLKDYEINGIQIPVHLTDIVDAGYRYNVYEYQRDFLKVYNKILSEGKIPVLCGGTGMYIEAVLKGYRLIQVPVNESLRAELACKSLDELTAVLSSYKKLHNTTDVDTKKRAIRAIEIEAYYREHTASQQEYPDIYSLIIGIRFEREVQRQRITLRLRERLACGMIEEAEQLLSSGLTPEQLIYYGLEYKYLTLYLTGKLSQDEMFNSLETSIHRFAKRQMTWFRRMERKGFEIHWLDGCLPMGSKIEKILSLMQNSY